MEELNHVLVCSRENPKSLMWDEECFRRGYSSETEDIINALKSKNINVSLLTFSPSSDFQEIFQVYPNILPDLVFNDFYGNLPGLNQKYVSFFRILDDSSIPHIFGKVETLEMLLSKHECQNKLRSSGIRCLPSIKTDGSDKKIIEEFVSAFNQVIVKPNRGYSSHGLALCESLNQTLDQVRYIMNMWGDESLIEEYIPNRTEYQVMMIGDREDQIFMPVRLVTPSGEIYTQELKNRDDENLVSRVHVNNKDMHLKLINLARQIVDCMDIKDFTRMEILERGGDLYPIDINGIPFMAKMCGNSEGSLVKFGEMFGYSYEDLIEKIFKSAYKRNHYEMSHSG